MYIRKIEGGREMKTIARGVLLILLLAVVVAVTSMATDTEEPETLKIGAIFAITGPSFLGVPESRTAEMLVEQINADGGVAGMQVELIVMDSGGAPEKALSFAKQLIEEEQVLAIIGPSTSGASMAIKQICEDSETLLLSLAAAEAIVVPTLDWVFKTPQTDAHAAQAIYAIMRGMGIEKVGIVAANSGFGNSGVGQLEKYAPEFGIELVIVESYDSTATDLTALMTKVNAAGVEAVVNWSIVDAQSIIPKNMRQLGMTQILFQSHGFGNIKYVEVAGEAAEGIIFPAGRLLVADVLPDGNPQKEVLIDYRNEYESRFNEAASTFGGHAYDALMILFAAIEEVGSADKYAVREAIENMRGFVGTGGVFNFSPEDHNGLGLDAFEILTVRNGEFVLYQ
jgi:branched-chain amino acid transport system substrate-binding protein